MRIYAFGVELVFDELVPEQCPSERSLQRFIFLTTLSITNINQLPDKLQKMYTSAVLKAQLSALYRSRGKELEECNFHILKPFEVARIQTEVDVDFEVLPCMPKDNSTSIMLAFRKAHNLKIEHLYAGFATDLSSMMLNPKFMLWLRASGDSIHNLYMLKVSKDRCSDCESKRAFRDLQNEYDNDNSGKLVIEVPLFGCEVFTAELASMYRNAIAIDGLLYEVFSKSCQAEMKHFSLDFDEAEIILSADDSNLEAESEIGATCHRSKLNWLPLPDACQLSLFTRLVNPKFQHELVNNISSESFHIKLTSYLYPTGAAEHADVQNNNSRIVPTCDCSKMEMPLNQSPVINHYSLEECMRHFVIAYTDQYQNADKYLSVEEELEKMFNSSQEEIEQEAATKAENTPLRATRNIPPRSSSREQPIVTAAESTSRELDTSTQRLPAQSTVPCSKETDDQPTTSSPAKKVIDAAPTKGTQKSPSLAEKLENYKRFAILKSPM